MSISYFAILFPILFGGGMGAPLSLPPGPPDALLDSLSPPEALYYSNWSGVAAPRKDSANQTEQLFAEPEIQELIARVEVVARSVLAKMGERDAGAAMASQIVPTVVKTVLTRPVMMYVSDVAIGPDGPKFRGGAVVNLGPHFGEVTRLLQMIPPEATESVTIDGTEMRRFRAEPEAPVVTFGTRGSYLLVAMGDNEAEQLLARAKQDAPQWLTALRTRFAVDRVATVTRLEAGKLIAQFAPLGGPQLMQMLEQTGLGGVQRFEGVTGLDETGFVQFAAVDFDGPLKGLMAATAADPLTADDLAAIPHNPLIAGVGRMNLGKLFDGAVEMMGSMNPRSVEDFNDGMQQMQQALGMRLREDILGSLGDVWTIHTAAEDGGLLSGWTMTVTVTNKAKLTQLSQRLMQMAAAAGGGDRDPRVEWSEFMGENIFMVNVPEEGMPFAPAWCVTADRLVVGLYPQAIKSYLLRRSEKAKLADEPKVAAALAGKPISISVVDNKRLMELAYPFAQLGLRMLSSAAEKEGLQLDYSLLPSLTCISRHLGLGVTTSRRTETGFELEQHQTMPGGSVGATAPISIALLLPAVQSARGAARRMESTNNMKQILLAMHNFHDTYRSFPPRYNTDKNGKPLLSWRVYLLPYVEQQGLYEQFHFDEPWDSPHNKKLIELMPATYRAPQSNLPAGQTTYLALASKDSILQPPSAKDNGERMPRTTSFANITDGTSNTVMVVQANDAHGVIWTKPADYEYADEDPAKGLRGALPNGLVLFGMGDGSVTNVSGAMSAADFKAFFTRSGGEVVPRIR